MQFDKGQTAPAHRPRWRGYRNTTSEDEYRTIARLRARRRAGDAKQYDEALKQLDGATARRSQALVADRRGDILLAQGKRDEAKAAYRKAWDAMADDANYRNLIEAKLTSLGAAPTAPAAAASAASGAAK